MPRLDVQSRSRFGKLLLIVCAVLVLSNRRTACAETPDAALVYQQKCASCHGKAGGGVPDRYEGPLYGEDSIAELAGRITETMPEDNPDACVGDEARSIAEYIYHEFYSKAARQAKGMLPKPRIELTRLTVPQFRNAVADLVGAFAPPLKRGYVSEPTANGLRGAYYKSRKMSKTEELKLVRVDPRIDFDFGTDGPINTIPGDQFAIIWQGSLQARDTGYYDFRMRSPNGVRLYLNSDPIKRDKKLRDDSNSSIQPRLIDGWVASGKMRELTGRMFLLGGRRYPVRLEFFKFKDPQASLRLEWKPPHGVWSVIDADALSTTPAQRTFVVDTPFPPDDRSIGYERGTSVSQQWHSAVANAALATADEVVARLPLLTKGISDSSDEQAVYGTFLARFASTAFRRPLHQNEETLYRKTLFEDATTESAIRRGVLLVLTSPQFLYANLPTSEATPDQHSVAARLAFTLWDSLPDAELRRIADRGRLGSQVQIEAQVDRMLADPRSRTKLQRFFRHWLELEERSLAKDQQMYPDFDEVVIADLRRSLELFVNRVVWSNSSDYRQLLLADYLLLNERLQGLYANDHDEPHAGQPANNQFVKIGSHSEGRSGILTHPYLLSAFAYHDKTSPIHRGVFLTRNIVGRQLKPPPVAVAFEDNDFAADLTMREKVTELTRDQACLSCHEVINPLGFALENFDAVGRWRARDNNKPIDTQSSYTSATGDTLTIDSARDIANFAVSSPVAQRAFIGQFFQHLTHQSPDAYGPEVIEDLREAFVNDNFHMRKLMVRIAMLVADHTTQHPPTLPASPPPESKS